MDGMRDMVCGECGKKWIAACFADSERLECPQCGFMVQVEPLSIPKKGLLMLEEYLRENCRRNAIEHVIRAICDDAGNVSFYIHPANVNGATLDFAVNGNQLLPLSISGVEPAAQAIAEARRASANTASLQFCWSCAKMMFCTCACNAPVTCPAWEYKPTKQQA